MPERTFDDFDGFANGYRDIHSQNIKLSGADSLYFAEYKILELKKFESNVPQQILDIGCGDGATEIFIQRNFPSWYTTAIDVSEKSLQQAKQRRLNNASFICYDGKEIPFEEGSFDIVFVAGVLHHIDFSLHNAFIKEIYRVLKKSGRIYVFEHNPLNPATRYLVKTCVFDRNAHLLSFRYTHRLLKSFRFTFIQKKFILFFPRKKMLFFFLNLEKRMGWLPFGAQYYFRAIK